LEWLRPDSESGERNEGRTRNLSIKAIATSGAVLISLSASGGNSRYLADALQAARWLSAASVQTRQGIAWPADPRDPESINNTLYSGTPGPVLFFLEAYAAAKNPAFLAAAKSGADDLLARLPEEKETGLYEGLGGIAFTLEEVYKATADERYRTGFLSCLKAIGAKASKAGKGIEWSPVTDIISGTAGTGLVLLYAYRELRDRAWLDLAAQAGDRLIELGKPKNGGLDWAMDPSFPRLMPNFSHGTAGVAYFLAVLYRESGEKRFLDAALAGASYLRSIAKTDGDICLIYHDEPDGKDLYYLGWCHGPVGTSNLFYMLFKATGDETWMEWVNKSARGIKTSGIPEKETPGFWNNDGLCCGLAGVADFFLSLYQVTGNADDVAFGRRVMSKLREKATVDAEGMRWIQAEHRVRPELLIAQAGLMQGAAGIGLAFLRWDAFEKGRKPAIWMPDNAFK
jgi:lantibiotic modifying enzyme